MRSYLSLVPASAKIHRRQNKMTRICITLAVFLVAVMFGLADMYLQGATEKVIQENGNWHYQFTSLDAKTAALISARPDVEVSGWHTVIREDAGYAVGEQTVAISAQDKDTFEEILLNEIIEGEYPNGEREIAVSSSLREKESLSLNETVKLSQPDGSMAEYLVVGFFEDTDTARLGAESELAIILTMDGLSTLFAADDRFLTESYMVQFSRFCEIPEAIQDIKTQNDLLDEQVAANLTLLSIEGQVEGKTGVNQIFQVALILSIIVVLTCVLMISSSLNSNVASRTEFFGMLRCLGATKNQIMRLVCYEGLRWCKTAIPIGVALSIVTVWIISGIMRIISPQWFSYMPVFGISWIGIVASVLLGVVTVLLSARSPAKKAARVSPLTAVSGNVTQTEHFREAANTHHFHIETAMGIYHAKARKKNYILMTAAFAICMVLFLTFSTLVDFMKNAFTPPVWTPELSIVSETNSCTIDSGFVEEVNKNRAVKRAYGRMFAYDVPAESNGKKYNTNVISYEENQFKWVGESLISGSVDSVMQQDGQVLFVQAEDADMKVGDKIVLSVGEEEHTVIVAGILSDSPLARVEGTETIFCSEKTFTGLTGQDQYTIVDVQFQKNASSEDVKAVEEIFGEDGVIFNDTFSQVRQQKRLYLAFAVLVYGFLSIIAAITSFHIMNTVSMGVAAKMKQYGVMRAIGMSNQQIIKMIAAEAGTYAVSGIALGCIVGLPMHWVVYVSLITNFWGTAWEIPVIPLGLIIGMIVFAAFLAVWGAKERIGEMTVVDTIKVQ